VSKLKPPTPASVSATLRHAGFAAWKPGRDEGYLCEWTQGEGSAVRVSWEAVTNELDELARKTMAATLTRKGWNVRDIGYLIVKER
jgi:hypothetical protein